MTDSWLDSADEVIAHEEEQAQKRAEATTWKPHSNDKHPQILKGKLIDGDIASTEYGETRVLTIEDAEGKMWTVWCGGMLLKDAVITQAPKVGAGIIIKHGGLKQPQKEGGREYRMWTMATEASDFAHWKEAKDRLNAAAAAAQENYSGGVAADELEAPY